MTLIPIFCPECPGWYDLPQGPPDHIYFWGKSTPPPSTQTLVGAVHMDLGHDYQFDRYQDPTRFKYSYSGGEGCWVILQYGEPEAIPCHSCGAESPASNFCPMCGISRNNT